MAAIKNDSNPQPMIFDKKDPSLEIEMEITPEAGNTSDGGMLETGRRV